jgi:hypothetical protein
MRTIWHLFVCGERSEVELRSTANVDLPRPSGVDPRVTCDGCGRFLAGVSHIASQTPTFNAG